PGSARLPFVPAPKIPRVARQPGRARLYGATAEGSALSGGVAKTPRSPKTENPLPGSGFSSTLLRGNQNL
ncbi:hypothetical protein ACPEH7_08385, partial [Stenotrophomonas sp. NPDC101269]|uniref:hypothetical protein n=1 Tax=Stenotrophomonas sp. NPDC101269 TaxID=3415003 RepID=UPI003C2F233E